MMYIDIGVNLALVCKVTLGRQTLTGSTPSTPFGHESKGREYNSSKCFKATNQEILNSVSIEIVKIRFSSIKSPGQVQVKKIR